MGMKYRQRFVARNEMLFRDRTDAGRRLANRLGQYGGKPDVVVLALPRGGVVVGYEVAGALQAPLDVLLVRKLGVPGHEELALGAIASGGVRVINENIIKMLGITSHEIEQIAALEQWELERRQQAYLAGREPVNVKGQTVILVDDGLATGATMRAAVEAMRFTRASRIVVAIPTAPLETRDLLAEMADEVVCLTMPEPFYGVGGSYMDFTQVSDEEVKSLLDQAVHFV